MPRYSRFYSPTETKAAISLPQLCPRHLGALHFSSNDAERLADLLNGTAASSSRPRNDVNQPLFRPRSGLKSVEELLADVSGFSIAREIVQREKFVNHDSNYEESTEEWKIRSRTPSSDEPSPRKACVTSSALSVKATASSDWSDDNVTHVMKQTHMDQLHNRVSPPGHYASYPDNVLQNMDTQFSKWSYDLDEGNTAIPFVMAQAPSDTHQSLVKVDRKFWITEESVNGETVSSQSEAKAVLERAQRKSLKPLESTKSAGAPKLTVSSSGGLAFTDESSSKRAALIAKSKAAKHSSLVISKTANQRRSAMHKNKNRRSIMPSPPPTARKLEPVKKTEAQTEEPPPTVLILDRKVNNQRRELDSALQNGTLDWNNDTHMELLMKQLKNTGANSDVDSREIRKSENTEHVGKTPRLKGKARKKAKNSAAC